MLTTLPCLRCCIAGTTARLASHSPFTFTANILSHASSGMSRQLPFSAGTLMKIAALLIRPSILP
jgi:hypothetical protein